MGEGITSDVVTKGIVYSIECACLFLKSANSLYREGNIPGAVVLGTVAAEHIGKCEWLYTQLEQVRSSTGNPDYQHFKKKWRHQKKIKYGLTWLCGEVPASYSPNKTYALIDRTRKDSATRFHKLREAAQYVDLNEDCRDWNRPINIDPRDAHDLLNSVGSSYRDLLLRRLSRDQDIERMIREIGIWDTLLDSHNVWPPSEGDQY